MLSDLCVRFPGNRRSPGGSGTDQPFHVSVTRCVSTLGAWDRSAPAPSAPDPARRRPPGMAEPANPSASVCTFLLLAWLLTGHSGAVRITSAGPQTVHVAEGDDIQIQCVFKLEPSDEGELDIEWSIINPDTTKPDPVILTYVHSQIFEYPSVFSGRFSFTEQNPSQGNASVRVRSLHLRDTNSFQCKVKKAPGIDTRKVTVKVHVQPQAPRCWTDRSGEEVWLQCHSEAGSPPLTYSWEKISGTRQGLPQNSVTDSGSGTLLIRNGTDPSLFGTYRCLVRNLVGMEDCELTLAAPAERTEAGVIVAAVLGAILALLLLLLLLLLLCCCCRKRHQKERPHDIREDATPPLSSAPSVRSVKSYKAHQTRKSESVYFHNTVPAVDSTQPLMSDQPVPSHHLPVILDEGSRLDFVV